MKSWEAATPIAKVCQHLLVLQPVKWFATQKASEEAETGKAVILVRDETSAEDIEGVCFSRYLTVRGGMTSHAAVVARSMVLAVLQLMFQ